MKLLIFVVILQNFLNSAHSCRTSCRKFTYRPYIERIKYLVRLPNSQRIANLSLIGTHSSLSSVLSEEQRTQDLTLNQQLKYGVRVFDIEVAANDSSSEFVITSSSVKINLDFDEILNKFERFLDENPGEFTILFLRSSSVEDKNNCEVLRRYFNFGRAGKRLVDHWKLEDTLGIHRGKILLATLDPSFGNCSLELEQCEIQSDSKVDNGGNVKNKWRNIYRFMLKSQLVNKQCLINDISFKDKKNSRRIVARDAGYYFEDMCKRPLNDILAHEFKKPKEKFAILFADFLTQELIDKVNDANFPNPSWRIGWD